MRHKKREVRRRTRRERWDDGQEERGETDKKREWDDGQEERGETTDKKREVRRRTRRERWDRQEERGETDKKREVRRTRRERWDGQEERGETDKMIADDLVSKWIRFGDLPFFLLIYLIGSTMLLFFNFVVIYLFIFDRQGYAVPPSFPYLFVINYLNFLFASTVFYCFSCFVITYLTLVSLSSKLSIPESIVVVFPRTIMIHP